MLHQTSLSKGNLLVPLSRSLAYRWASCDHKRCVIATCFRHPKAISTGRRPRTCTISPRTAYSALMTFELIVSKLSGAFPVFGIVRCPLTVPITPLNRRIIQSPAYPRALIRIECARIEGATSFATSGDRHTTVKTVGVDRSTQSYLSPHSSICSDWRALEAASAASLVTASVAMAPTPYNSSCAGCSDAPPDAAASAATRPAPPRKTYANVPGSIPAHEAATYSKNEMLVTPRA